MKWRFLIDFEICPSADSSQVTGSNYTHKEGDAMRTIMTEEGYDLLMARMRKLLSDFDKGEGVVKDDDLRAIQSGLQALVKYIEKIGDCKKPLTAGLRARIEAICPYIDDGLLTDADIKDCMDTMLAQIDDYYPFFTGTEADFDLAKERALNGHLNVLEKLAACRLTERLKSPEKI